MLNMDAVDRSADCPVGVDAAAMKKSKGDSAAGCSTASVCPGREKERVEEREERAGLPAWNWNAQVQRCTLRATFK